MNDSTLPGYANSSLPTGHNLHESVRNIRNASWRPTFMIQMSCILHAASFIVYVVHPTFWPWIITALIVNHLALGAAVLWPRGQLLGPNWVRLPAFAIKRSEVSLTFDDGPDPEVTPQILELLDRYQVKASFFCVGEKVAAFRRFWHGNPRRKLPRG